MFQMFFGDQWFYFGCWIVWQFVLDVGYGFVEFVNEFLVDFFLYIEVVCGGIVLVGVVEVEGVDVFDGGIDVGIVEDQYRSFVF